MYIATPAPVSSCVTGVSSFTRYSQLAIWLQPVRLQAAAQSCSWYLCTIAIHKRLVGCGHFKWRMNATEEEDETVGFLNEHSSVSGGGSGAPRVVLQRQVRLYRLSHQSVCMVYYIKIDLIMLLLPKSCQSRQILEGRYRRTYERQRIPKQIFLNSPAMGN